jgi:aryl-alcohol dehydrogenase-like predicted oxidoreductase
MSISSILPMAYGPDVSERLIHEALHPYRGILVATKGRMTRQGPGQGRMSPQQAFNSLTRHSRARSRWPRNRD